MTFDAKRLRRVYCVENHCDRPISRSLCHEVNMAMIRDDKDKRSILHIIRSQSLKINMTRDHNDRNSPETTV